MPSPWSAGFRRSLLGFVLLAVVATFAGCGAASSGQSNTGRDTLVVALPTFEVDSPFGWEINALGRPPYEPAIETLVAYDPSTNDLKPQLAQSYDHNADYTRWTLHLRKGVQFQGGYGEFTSADVLYNFKRGQDKSATGTTAQLWATLFKGITAPDKYTVVLTFQRPQYNLASLVQIGMNSEAYIKKVGDEQARHHPIGTGPYEFVSGTPGEEYDYKAVSNHWRITPDFKYLKIRVIPDPNTVSAALRSGEIDAAVVSGQALASLKGSVKLFEDKDGTPNWIVFPGTGVPGTPGYKPDLPWNPIEGDPASVARALKVREALNLGFNKQAIIDSVWKGHGSTDAPFGWYVRPWDRAYSDSLPKVPDYDPGKAKQLLAEAGYSNGFTFPVIIDKGLQPDSDVILAAFAQDMAKIGVKVDVTSMEHATLVGHLRAGNLSGAFVYSVPTRTDQSSTESLLAKTSMFRFLNTFPSQFDAAANAATGGPDAEDAFVQKMAKLESDRYATIPIGLQSTVVATSSKVASWPIVGGQTFLMNFENVKKAK